MKEIYLDNAASMPMPKRVIQDVSKANELYYANPFSLHKQGILALKALMKARKELAEELGVKAEEIVFTSGGTESNALAVIGIAKAQKRRDKNKIIISSIEHSSVYENAEKLKSEGFTLSEIPADEKTGLKIDFLKKEIDDKTGIVSVVSVNSDTGIMNDIAELAKICKQKGVLLHVDHLQGFGKIKLQPKSLGVDLLSADAHKIGGPKGIGLLYVKSGLDIEPLFRGGGKENILRAGTENVSGAVGFASALKEYKKINWRKVEQSRNELQGKLEALGARITGKNAKRAVTHLHVCFRGISGAELVNYLSTKGIYCTTGSACDSNKIDKRILTNLGLPSEYIGGALRFSFAKPISSSESDYVSNRIQSFLNIKAKG